MEKKIKEDILEQCKHNENAICVCLSARPEYIYDCPLTPDDFHMDLWRMYYSLVHYVIIENQGKALDAINTAAYFGTHRADADVYDKYGGQDILTQLKEVSQTKGLIDTDNFKSYVKELIKWNYLLRLYESRFPISDNISDYKDKSVMSVKDEMLIKLDSLQPALEVNENGTTLTDLTGYWKELEDPQNTTKAVPFYNASELNYLTGGFRLDGKVYGLGAASGVGKSSMMFNWLITSCMLNKERLVVFINEEEKKRFMIDLTAWIINNKLSRPENYFFNKSTHLKHSELDKKYIKMAQEWFDNGDYGSYVTIVPLQTYTADIVASRIRYFAAKGVRAFALDTFKEGADSSGETYLTMMRDMRKLYDVVKPAGCNVGLFVTYQLGKQATVQPYLTNNDVGQAKSIVDVMDVNIMIRRPKPYEVGQSMDKKKRPLYCFAYRKDESGKHEKMEFTISSAQNHMIVFITKNRFGLTDPYQIVQVCDLGHNRVYDIGRCDVVDN